MNRQGEEEFVSCLACLKPLLHVFVMNTSTDSQGESRQEATAEVCRAVGRRGLRCYEHDGATSEQVEDHYWSLLC